MERLAIKKFEDLPYLVTKLKGTNSSLVRDWNVEFNPTLKYRTSVDMMDVQIEFWGEHWEEAQHLYSMVCEEYQLRLTVNKFVWFMENTTIVNNALYGNSEFNLFVRERGAYEEVIEFIDSHPLIDVKDNYIEVVYTEEYLEMLSYLGMEFDKGKYMFRSNKGYYLPIDIKIKYRNELDWVKGTEDYKKRSIEIRHTPKVEIICNDKGSFYRLARGLYKEEGNYELIIEWVDDPYREEYEVMKGSVRVKVVDVWKKENKEYMLAAKRLQSISKRKLEAYKVKDIIEQSDWTPYGIKLDEEYYQRLTIPKDRIVGKYNEVGENIYSEGSSLLGRREPITLDFEGFSIHTPYELVIEGEYQEPLIPLTRPDLAKESKEYLDSDVKIVLGYKEDKEEGLLNKGLGEVNKEKYQLNQYPRTEIHEEDLPDVKSLVQKESDKRLTGEIEDVLYIPYVESYHIGEELVQIFYKEGDRLDLVGSVSEIPNFMTRVVFKDVIGVEYEEYAGKIIDLLMSLSTDEIEYNGFLELEEGLRVNVREVIDKWLEAIKSGSEGTLAESMVKFQDEVTVEEEELDIFDQFDIFV